jgi:hypothetical protein
MVFLPRPISLSRNLLCPIEQFILLIFPAPTWDWPSAGNSAGARPWSLALLPCSHNAPVVPQSRFLAWGALQVR